VDIDITGQVTKSKAKPFDGPFSTIYRGTWAAVANQRGTLSVVAIKVIRTGFNERSNPQDRQEFEKVFDSCLNKWFSLNHENLAPLLGIVKDMGGRFPAIVTPWMNLGLLTEYLNSEQEFNRTELALGVGKGVAYLHANDIVHSGLRATSVLVDENGIPKLADPGMHNILQHSPLVQDGSISPPVRWSAPELLTDEPGSFTFKSDVYAFTMTTVEIFTGAVPFKGLRDDVVSRKVSAGDRPPRPSGVSDTLWAVLNEGWDADESKRPTMDIMVQRIQ